MATPEQIAAALERGKARAASQAAKDRAFDVLAASARSSGNANGLFEGNTPSLGAMSFASPALVPGVAPLEGQFAFSRLATPSPYLDAPVRVGTSVPWNFATDTQAAPPPARALIPYAQRPAAPAGPPMLYGTLPDTAKYDAAVAAGTITPQQVTAYEAAKARAGATPLGLTAEGMQIDSAKRKADLVAAGAEQTSVANALERDTKAQEAAAVTEREQIATYEKMRAEFDTSQATRVAEMDAMKTDIAATKIDPSQYFSKGNAFGNVLSLLAVALGGYAEGYSGGRLKNNALAMLQNSIDNDIAAQKANLDNKKSALGAAQSIYGLARQQFGDDQQAAEFTRARQNDVLKTQALRFANEGRTEAIRANATKLAEHLGLESKKGDNAVSLLHANAEQQRIAAAHRGGGGGGATPEEKAFDKELALRSRLAGVRKSEAEATKSEREATDEGEARKGKEIVNYNGESYSVDKSAAVALRAAAAAAEASKEQTESLISKSSGAYHTLFPGMSKKQSEAQPLLGSLRAGMATVLSSGGMPSDKSEATARGIISEVPQLQDEGNWAAGLRQVPGMMDSRVRSMLGASDARLVGGEPKGEYKTYKSSK